MVILPQGLAGKLEAVYFNNSNSRTLDLPESNFPNAIDKKNSAKKLSRDSTAKLLGA